MIDEQSTTPLWKKNFVWLFIIGVFFITSLITFGTGYFGEQIYRDDQRVILTVVNEFTGSYTAAPLLVILFFINRSVPINRNKLGLKLLFYATVFVLMGITHTTLMTLTRNMIYPWIEGLGDYHPGDLFHRYAFEMTKQIQSYCFVTGVFEWIRYYRNSQKEKLLKAELERALAQTRLDALKQQLNPHFLFNSLNLISVKAYEDPATADQLITKLSDLLRMSLELGKGQTIRLREELQFIGDYVDIMLARFEKRIRFSVEQEESLDDAMVPSLILQPAVENAIKHGLDDSDRAIDISIHISGQEGKLNLAVMNSILNPEQTASPFSTGLGIKSVRERLNTLYPNQYDLTYGMMGDGRFRFRITIPLRRSREATAS